MKGLQQKLSYLPALVLRYSAGRMIMDMDARNVETRGLPFHKQPNKRKKKIGY